MYRRSLRVLAQQSARRTVVRDPRKRPPKTTIVPSTSIVPSEDSRMQPAPQPPPQTPFLMQQQQGSVGSTLGSYALMGVGVTLGMVLVRVVLGF
jgi:hypothetical protein